jgi:hypothetical protein
MLLALSLFPVEVLNTGTILFSINLSVPDGVFLMSLFSSKVSTTVQLSEYVRTFQERL